LKMGGGSSDVRDGGGRIGIFGGERFWVETKNPLQGDKQERNAITEKRSKKDGICRRKSRNGVIKGRERRKPPLIGGEAWEAK